MAGLSARERAERDARRRSRAYAIRQEVHARRVARRRRDDLRAGIAFVVLVTLATTAQVLFFTAGPGVPAPTPSSSSSTTPAPSASAGADPSSSATPQQSASATPEPDRTP